MWIVNSGKLKDFLFIKKNFRLFYYCKSTAFIVPVLFLFLEKELGMTVPQILMISGFYYLLPIIFEVPFGIVADRFGQSKILSLGLMLQIVSCLTFLFFDSHLTYHIYLFGMSLAQCCYSGADMALLKSYFYNNGRSDLEFKEFVVDLESRFYFITILFIILGCISYYIYPKFVFVLQIMLFLCSLLFLNKLPKSDALRTQKSVIKQIVQEKDKLKLTFYFLVSDKNYLSIWLIGLIFSSVILINHKTIQSQISNSVLSVDLLLVVSIVYVLGNLSSSIGAKCFLKFCKKDDNFNHQIILLIFWFAVSYTFLSMNWSFLLGFLILCAFKAAYRPIIQSELTNRIPFRDSIATILSILNLFSSIAISIIHVILSFTYNDIIYGNFVVLSISLFILISLFFVQMYVGNNWSFLLYKSNITGKESKVVCDGNKIYLDQYYPEKERENLLETIKLSNWYANEEKNIIYKGDKIISRSLYYGSTLLSDIKINKKVYEYCDYILNSLLIKNIDIDVSTYRVAPIPRIEDIFSSETVIQTMYGISNDCIIHGDLHPENIIINDNLVKLVDWDMSGVGYYWFDVLTLLSHPDTSLNTEEVLSLLDKYLLSSSNEKLSLILMEFMLFKRDQLLQLSSLDEKFIKLSDQYLCQWRVWGELYPACNRKM